MEFHYSLEENYFRKRLVLVAKKTLSYISMRNSHVELFFLFASEMKAIEKRYGVRKRGHIPDVLSFAEPDGFPHPETSAHVLGEVYLNTELIQKDFDRRLTFLLIHGILHLAGYSHSGKNDTLTMESLERRIFKQVFKK